MKRRLVLFAAVSFSLLSSNVGAERHTFETVASQIHASPYAAAVLRDSPAAWWRMQPSAIDSDNEVGGDFPRKQIRDEKKLKTISWVVRPSVVSGRKNTTDALRAEPVGDVLPRAEGPAGTEYPDLDLKNVAVRLDGNRDYLRVADTGDQSPLDFDNGDSITIEAWVQPQRSGEGHAYIVGKGRTLNRGFSSRNQNYSLRLAYSRGGARLSFFFVDRETKTANGSKDDGHRWTSDDSFPLDNRWHHVAITYTFGSPDSIVGFIDGEPTNGVWGIGGATRKPPVVDNDDLWIGAAMGGRANFTGGIDEVAIYRRALPSEAIARHVRLKRPKKMFDLIRGIASSPEVAKQGVQVDVYENISDAPSWNVTSLDGQRLTMSSGNRQLAYRTDLFALTELPRKYNDRGLILDRSTPLLIHAHAGIALPAGPQQLLLRSLNGARLYVDERLLAETAFLKPASNGHGSVDELEPSSPERLSRPAVHHEQVFSWESDGAPHLFSLFAIVGLSARPPELGELVVAVSEEDGSWSILGKKDPRNIEAICDDLGVTLESDLWSVQGRALQDEYGRFNDAGWLAFLERDYFRRRSWEARDRRQKNRQQHEYWNRRHEWAKQVIESSSSIVPPEVEQVEHVNNDVDRFVQRRIEDQRLEPSALVSDAEFLRRVSLDVIGVIPSLLEIDRYFSDPPSTRREQVVDRLLDHPGWADHWVGYWQSVLAENPGVIKPSLNNSGPFRWFIHEAFLDNWPFDRFLTELVLMEGGKLSGGPAGFGMAANNDQPMAAKAHVLGTAFLGIEMKCARCHDAPHHESKQEDLFQLAAMLARRPLAVPESSSVPATPEQLSRMAVTVSLQPGVPVKPNWPFGDVVSASYQDVPADLVHDPDDLRQRLAWRMTHPSNQRMANVIVNRIWKRYLGRGLVDPVHDWEDVDCSHPDLLTFLSDELVRHGYDLKHIARLILNSQAYQRAVMQKVVQKGNSATSSDDDGVDLDQLQSLFATGIRRKMSAEQLVDSLMKSCGKDFDSEQLSLNPDGRQVAVKFLNLGFPRRAWQFACTTNDRERPSTTLPRAQSVINLMMAYGWRQDRQEPVNEWEAELTPLSPLLLANGTASARAVDLSDNGGLVELCLKTQPVDELVRQMHLRFLTREPTSSETRTFVELLAEGYESRRTGVAKSTPRVNRSPLSWSNNLNAKANEIGQERQQQTMSGDPPTRRITDSWRQRMEDFVWVLVNSPEFVHLP